ncbi:MAG: hypothetical protein AAF349_06690 [Cyanobacteria bacterium P01_A01_bin.68]
MARNKRLSITLSDYHNNLLEVFARSRGEAPTTSATDIIKIRLEQLAPDIEKIEAEEKASVGEFLEALVGNKNLSEVNLKAIAKMVGKPVELLEAVVEQHNQL